MYIHFLHLEEMFPISVIELQEFQKAKSVVNTAGSLSRTLEVSRG
jgi:hypothetical protein